MFHRTGRRNSLPLIKLATVFIRQFTKPSAKWLIIYAKDYTLVNRFCIAIGRMYLGTIGALADANGNGKELEKQQQMAQREKDRQAAVEAAAAVAMALSQGHNNGTIGGGGGIGKQDKKGMTSGGAKGSGTTKPCKKAIGATSSSPTPRMPYSLTPPFPSSPKLSSAKSMTSTKVNNADTPGHSSADTPGHSRADTPGHSSADTPGHSSADTPGHSSADTPGHSSADTPGHSSAPGINTSRVGGNKPTLTRPPIAVTGSVPTPPVAYSTGLRPQYPPAKSSFFALCDPLTVIKSRYFTPQVPEKVLLDTGAELLVEMIVFCVFSAVVCYEVYTAREADRRREENQLQRIRNLEEKVNEIAKMHESINEITVQHYHPPSGIISSVWGGVGSLCSPVASLLSSSLSSPSLPSPSSPSPLIINVKKDISPTNRCNDNGGSISSNNNNNNNKETVNRKESGATKTTSVPPATNAVT